MNKTALYAAISFVLSLVVMWLIGAYVGMEINPMEWDAGSRFIHVGSAAIAAFVWVCIVEDGEDDD